MNGHFSVFHSHGAANGCPALETATAGAEVDWNTNIAALLTGLPITANRWSIFEFGRCIGPYPSLNVSEA
jgi:hypothetical protein